ncbi:MAG TPA: peptide chain release factor N(5)-glutamine methyltransferase [Anaerolineae bacterium]|jgi:release factor glutamine methyltransferase|nr:peptide chain release factor N(5)-glutamine methyltransferase [Anaerolineae bacterium]
MAAVKTFTIGEAINWATLQLEGGSLFGARVEAERIISDATGLARAELYLNRERTLCAPECDFIELAVAKRLSGVPLQYVLGHQQFRFLDLVCRENVLIPRPETELLVEEALVELRSLGGPRLVMDIGCGTGAIALSIAHEYSDAFIYATDVSPAAIELTGENARRSGLSAGVQIIQSDLFKDIGDLRGRLDMVVSNPPYIPHGELGSLQREVQFEPNLALDGGEDGLNFYRAIVEHSPEFLKPGGILLLEVGFGQAAEVATLCNDTGHFTRIDVKKDYQGIERIIKAKRG